MNTLLAGVSSRRIPTSRLTVNVLELPGRTGIPVVFVHGNVSSSLFRQPTMLALPAAYRPIAVDLRGFGDTDPAPVDATRGVRDFADDLAATIDALELPPIHLVGWSLGGVVREQYPIVGDDHAIGADSDIHRERAYRRSIRAGPPPSHPPVEPGRERARTVRRDCRMVVDQNLPAADPSDDLGPAENRCGHQRDRMAVPRTSCARSTVRRATTRS